MASIAVVTGASGYVATEVVKQLLEKGYTVRATVRSISKADKVSHLLSLGHALPGKIVLYEADNLVEGSFDAVVHGATYVFHTASPVRPQVKDPQKDLVDPAVSGTLNLLRAVARSKNTIRRVILTSSLTAVMSLKPQKGPVNGSLYTEEDWNTESTLETAPYPFSKIKAERAAWAFAEEEAIDMVSILPSLVLGPVISGRSDAASIEYFKAFVEDGADIQIKIQVDIRDVGRAHVLAAETESASGRYLVSQRSLYSTALGSRVLSKRFPYFSIPAGVDSPTAELLDNTKVQNELGLVFHSMEETYVDMAVTLMQRGLLKFRPTS